MNETNAKTHLRAWEDRKRLARIIRMTLANLAEANYVIREMGLE